MIRWTRTLSCALVAFLVTSVFTAHAQFPFAEKMDVKITHKDLHHVAVELREWNELAPILGLTVADKTAIRNNNRTSYYGQKMAALEKWQERLGDAATYHALAEAATEAKNINLAHFIQKLVKQDNKKENAVVDHMISKPENIFAQSAGKAL